MSHAFGWYEEQRQGLGIDFFDEVSAALNRIRSHPLAYAEIETTIRRAFTHRFPYSIYFDISENIYIFAVLHQKQNHRSWLSRKGTLPPASS